MYKSRERRTAPGRARSFPFSASFSRKPTRVTKRGLLSFSLPPPLSFSLSPAGRFMCLYKPETSANCSQLVCMYHVRRVCMRPARISGDKQKLPCVDLKDVNCHLWKEDGLQERARRALFPRCGRGLLNVNYATSLSSNYSLCRSLAPRKRRRSRGTNRFTKECRKRTVKKFLPLKILTFHFFDVQATLIFFGSLVYTDRLTRVSSTILCYIYF